MTTKIPRRWLFPICNYAYRGTLALFANVQVSGRERIPTSGGAIVVCNHVSNLDPPTVATVLPRPPMALAKREIFSNPLFGYLLRAWGAHPVSRDSADVSALKYLRGVLDQDELVMMFPEGTRSRNGVGMRGGHIGAALLAAWTGATVVPLGISGTEHMQIVLRTLVPTGKIELSVGEPFRVQADPRDRAELRAATKEIMYRIAGQVPGHLRGQYADVGETEFVLTQTVASESDAAAGETGASSPTRAESSPTGDAAR